MATPAINRPRGHDAQHLGHHVSQLGKVAARKNAAEAKTAERFASLDALETAGIGPGWCCLEIVLERLDSGFCSVL
ncbi:MAG TPA: hypothetical protein VG758_26740, partial [Hyphomicrobiaceae bacterium]|nr:hypothetical protein [Hyphomicrobiaceae bacterium]